MGKMKDKFIDQINNQGPDDTDWDASNELAPPPKEINLETGMSMWVIKDYKIWAYNYQQALELLPMIESF